MFCFLCILLLNTCFLPGAGLRIHFANFPCGRTHGTSDIASKVADTILDGAQGGTMHPTTRMAAHDEASVGAKHP